MKTPYPFYPGEVALANQRLLDEAYIAFGRLVNSDGIPIRVGSFINYRTDAIECSFAISRTVIHHARLELIELIAYNVTRALYDMVYEVHTKD